MKRTPRAAGHAAHTQDAATAGLSGRMDRRIKLVFLGAGSFFAPRLVNDVVRIPGNRGGTIALVDIDAARLALSARLVRKLVRVVAPEVSWKVVASTERVEVLADADYVVNCIEVSGLECVVHDNDIPLKYGVDQCIGDTIGPGGLFKALRTIPVWLEALRDCERLCPRAIVLNYTNPMSMMCLAAGRTSSMEVVGLCHSVQGTSRLLAELAGVPYDELDWTCAGINHLAWFTRLEHRGASLYPRLRAQFERDIAEGIAEYDAGLVTQDATDDSHGAQVAVRYRHRELVRKDMCVHFGAFITESSGHLSEYLPYYRKSEVGRKLLRLGYHGGSRFYATNWPHWREQLDRQRRAMLSGKEPIGWERSWEYASWIIEAREKDVPFRIHGNVMNSRAGAGQLITNLPADSCVEVATLIDGNGVQPTRFGALPPQMAAVCASNTSMFDLGAQAAIDRSIEKAIYALMLDPLTAAVCAPAQIKAMALELFATEREFLPGYR
ncbi:alpha-glucosidase/alpha-galactosidase [Congregicoccus parvus]|uniref:alpha-glucosidase/alpha-galactosidase n=1 Tax=Congregicoccus parvus TaxID=3081749 RepID=UPI003FA5A62B